MRLSPVQHVPPFGASWRDAARYRRNRSRVRTLRAFPFPPEHAAATVTLTWLEDDGVTLGSSDRMVISCELYCTPQTLRLSARVTLHGDGRGWRPAFRTIEVRLPEAERRPLAIEQECWTNHAKSEDVVFSV